MKIESQNSNFNYVKNEDNNLRKSSNSHSFKKINVEKSPNPITLFLNNVLILFQNFINYLVCDCFRAPKEDATSLKFSASPFISPGSTGGEAQRPGIPDNMPMKDSLKMESYHTIRDQAAAMKVKRVVNQLNRFSVNPVALKATEKSLNPVTRVEEEVLIPKESVDDLIQKENQPIPDFTVWYSRDELISTLRTLYIDDDPKHNEKIFQAINSMKSKNNYIHVDEINSVYKIDLNKLAKYVSSFELLKSDLSPTVKSKVSEAVQSYATDLSAISIKTGEGESIREELAYKEAKAFGMDHLLLKKEIRNVPGAKLERTKKSEYLVAPWIDNAADLPVMPWYKFADYNNKVKKGLFRAPNAVLHEATVQILESKKVEAFSGIDPKSAQEHLILDLRLIAFDNHFDQYKVRGDQIVNLDYGRFGTPERYGRWGNGTFFVFRSVFLDHPAAHEPMDGKTFEHLKGESAEKYYSKRFEANEAIYDLDNMEGILKEWDRINTISEESKAAFKKHLTKIKETKVPLEESDRNYLLNVASTFGNRYLNDEAKILTDDHLKQIAYATVWYKGTETAYQHLEHLKSKITPQEYSDLREKLKFSMKQVHPIALSRQIQESQRIGEWAREWKGEKNPTPLDLMYALMPEMRAIMPVAERLLLFPGVTLTMFMNPQKQQREYRSLEALLEMAKTQNLISPAEEAAYLEALEKINKGPVMENTQFSTSMEL